VAKIKEKTWREQTVQNVGMGNVRTAYFKDTDPNYILISNTCPSPLYISTSPRVSDSEADMIVPAFGRQLFSQAHGIEELFLLCYDSDAHSVRLKSWEGEFDPASIPQTTDTSNSNPNQKLGNVTVTNFPSEQDVNVLNDIRISNFPATQDVNLSTSGIVLPVDIQGLNVGTGEVLPVSVTDNAIVTQYEVGSIVDPTQNKLFNHDVKGKSFAVAVRWGTNTDFVLERAYVVPDTDNTLLLPYEDIITATAIDTGGYREDCLSKRARFRITNNGLTSATITSITIVDFL
jgi:hypothetical protein